MDTLGLLNEIQRRSELSKSQHFNAAERCKYVSNILNTPVIVINVALGSVFFYAINNEIPELAKWIGAFLALVAALCSGFHRFYNFESAMEAHRAIGNKYLAVRDKCQRSQALYEDGFITGEDLVKSLNNIQETVTAIREEDAGCPTCAIDFKRAKRSYEMKHYSKVKRIQVRESDRSFSPRIV